MEIILIAAIGIGILMFLLLLFKKGKNHQDYFLVGWILITLLQIAFYEITIYRFALYGIWAILGFSLPLLGAPLLFLYILSLIGHRVTLKTINWHLSFFVIYVVVLVVLSASDNVDFITINGYLSSSNNTILWMDYYAVPLAISALVYFIWDQILLKRHQLVIASNFSFEEKINLKWMSYIVYLYVLLFIITSFLIFGSIHFHLFQMENTFALVAICLSLMLIAMAFYGFKQTSIFSSINSKNIYDLTAAVAVSEKSSYSRSGLTPEKMEQIANHLISYMEIEKPFLNENLNLLALSNQTEISQAHLSQVINQYFQKNFYDFVNQYRIEEAQKMLKSSDFKKLSVLGIAFDCGFKSKSSFNRHFKKHTGLSPSEFQKD